MDNQANSIDEDLAFERYQSLLKKVPFDQSKMSLTKFGVEQHQTEWRMLRQLLLNYDGKKYDISRAELGREKAQRRIETLGREASRLGAYRTRIESCETEEQLREISQITVTRQEGDGEYKTKISPRDTFACYGDFDRAREDVLAQVDDAIFMTESQIDGGRLDIRQTERILSEAREQAGLWESQIKGLLPKIQALEEAGIGFEEQELEYWTNRFKKDIEMGLLTGGNVDPSILKSVSELPKPCQEEIIQFANRVRGEASQRQFALPVEFKSPLHAAKRVLPPGVERGAAETRLLAEHSRKVRVVVAMPRREESDFYTSGIENGLVAPMGTEIRTLECFGMPIDRARNWCVEQMLSAGQAEGADWLFFVDCDVLLPRNALAALLEAAYGGLADLNPCRGIKEKIIGGYYTKKVRPLQSASVLYKENPDWDGADEETRLIVAAAEAPDGEPDAVIPINGILASGCLLIHRSVLQRFGEGDWFRELRDEKADMLATDDYHFTQKALELGYSPKLHCGVRCVHMDKRRNIAYGDLEPDTEYCTSKTGAAVMSQSPDAETSRVLICSPRRGEFEAFETDGSRMLASKSAEWAWWNPVGLGVAAARNQAVRTAIGNGCDFLLFIDSDIIVPRNILDRLLATGKPLVGAMYPMKTMDHRCAHILLDGDGKASHAPMDGEGLLECNRAMGMGCTLISCDLLRDVERVFTEEDWRMFSGKGCAASEIGSWFVGFPREDKDSPEDGRWEDSFFTSQAIQCGYTPWLLLDAHCVHVARKAGRPPLREQVRYYGHPDLVNQTTFSLEETARELLAAPEVGYTLSKPAVCR